MEVLGLHLDFIDVTVENLSLQISLFQTYLSLPITESSMFFNLNVN